MATTTISLTDNLLKSGDTPTVTITFSTWLNLTASALTVPNGSLSNLHSADEGLTWTATLTPAAGTTAAHNVITLDNTAVGGTGTTTSANYAVDTVAPTATSLVMVDTTLNATDRTVIHLTFSEAVTGVTNASIVGGYGTVSGMASSDGGITWDADFTPQSGVVISGMALSFNTSGITDLAGNAVAGAISGSTYSIDTVKPAATITMRYRPWHRRNGDRDHHVQRDRHRFHARRPDDDARCPVQPGVERWRPDLGRDLHAEPERCRYRQRHHARHDRRHG
jgi:hypothetical protein